MKLYKCPSCGRPALFDTGISDADTVKCGCCGYVSYLSAFKDNKNDSETVSAPVIGNEILSSIASIAFGIDTGNTAASLEGYIKQLCSQLKISPWTAIELLNAFLDLRSAQPPMYNPRRFAQIVPCTVNLDELLSEVRSAAAESASTPAEPAPAQKDSEGDDIWHTRFLDLQEKYNKLQSTDAQLLAEYKKIRQEREDIRNQYGI